MREDVVSLSRVELNFYCGHVVDHGHWIGSLVIDRIGALNPDHEVDTSVREVLAYQLYLGGGVAHWVIHNGVFIGRDHIVTHHTNA